MKFRMWMEKRNQRSSTKMPEIKSSTELHVAASKKAAHEMQHGKAGKMIPKPLKGTRSKHNRDAIKDHS
jgi:hypothetical protein